MSNEALVAGTLWSRQPAATGLHSVEGLARRSSAAGGNIVAVALVTSAYIILGTAQD